MSDRTPLSPGVAAFIQWAFVILIIALLAIVVIAFGRWVLA